MALFSQRLEPPQNPGRFTLLMIHSLEPKGDAVTGPIAAFGMSFPYGDYSTTINVVVNKVWLQQMQGYVDDPDEEEDYDA